MDDYVTELLYVGKKSICIHVCAMIEKKKANSVTTNLPTL